MDYLKPNFSNHWGNYLFIAMAFFIGYLFSSVAFAEPQINMGTYPTSTDALAACNAYRSVIQAQTFGDPPTPYYAEFCNSSVNMRYTQKKLTSAHSPIERYNFYYGACPAGTEPNPANGNKCEGPPPPPENCTDLQGQTWSVTINEGWPSTESCNQGCSGTISGLSISVYPYTQQYTYSGLSCPGGTGYDPTASGGEPSYDPEAPPKICKDANGYAYGSVSANAECPTRQNCYDETTGDFAATASGSASCPTGTTTNAEKDWQENVATGQTSESTTNPDGSTETNTETTYQHTGGDGKTYTTTKRSTTTCDPQGVCSTETTETTAQAACEGDDCPEEMQKPEVGDLEDCAKEYMCKGDVLQCARLKVQWTQACSLSESSFNDWKNSDDYANNYEAGEDGEGQLDQLAKGGTFNIPDSLDFNSWLGDDGTTAACPAPIEVGWIVVDISPFCDWAGLIRPPLILFNVLQILFFVRRSLLGG